MVRAKFMLNSVTNYPGGTAQSFKFNAVYDTGTEENKRFSKYTPSGELTMYVDNPPAQEFFKLGKSYYLDFSEVPDAPSN